MVTSSTAPSVPLDSSPPIWRQIADELASAIASGQYGPGENLPTALALSERFGVHRHTARQALLYLQQMGLVSVERGRGTFVTQPHLPYRIGRRVRFRGNAEAAGVAVEGNILAVDVMDVEDAVAIALGMVVGEEVWKIETLSRAAGVVISTGTHFLEKARFPDFERHLRSGSVSITRALQASGIPDYLRLQTALTARNATPEEARLLEIPAGAAVMLSRGLDGLPDGRPLHLVVALFVAERVEFLIEQDEVPTAS